MVRESDPPHQTCYPVVSLGKVLEHAWHLKKEGYRESTITARVKALKGIARKTDLFDPEAVKGTVALLDCSEARKEVLVCVYTRFLKQYNIPFNPPKYHRIEKLPFIPQESEIDQLIAGIGPRHATFLRA